VVAADLLKVYLRELPVSVIPHYQYDVFRVLYSSKMNVLDHASRISYIRELIVNLPRFHFHLLQHLVRHLKTFQMAVKNYQHRSQYISALSYTWGPLILRPLSEILTQSIKDSHTFQLMKDLILHDTDIFSE